MKRDRAAIRQRLQAEPFCRLCGSWQNLDPHHIVPRSITQDDSAENIVPLCRPCHDAVEAKRIDLLPHLKSYEQAKAVLLAGSIEAARMLLAPSAYRNGRVPA